MICSTHTFQQHSKHVDHGYQHTNRLTYRHYKYEFFLLKGFFFTYVVIYYLAVSSPECRMFWEGQQLCGCLSPTSTVSNRVYFFHSCQGCYTVFNFPAEELSAACPRGHQSLSLSVKKTFHSRAERGTSWPVLRHNLSHAAINLREKAKKCYILI